MDQTTYHKVWNHIMCMLNTIFINVTMLVHVDVIIIICRSIVKFLHSDHVISRALNLEYSFIKYCNLMGPHHIAGTLNPIEQ